MKIKFMLRICLASLFLASLFSNSANAAAERVVKDSGEEKSVEVRVVNNSDQTVIVYTAPKVASWRVFSRAYHLTGALSHGNQISLNPGEETFLNVADGHEVAAYRVSLVGATANVQAVCAVATSLCSGGVIAGATAGAAQSGSAYWPGARAKVPVDKELFIINGATKGSISFSEIDDVDESEVQDD